MNQIDVTTDIARRLIAEQFPSLEPIVAVRVGRGMDNAAFLVNDAWLFRFPRHAIAAALLEKENRLLGVIAPALPIPVPFPLFFGKPGAEFPWAFAGYQWLIGATACSIELSQDVRSALAQPLAHFLRTLHAIYVEVGEECGLAPDQNGELEHRRCYPFAKANLEVLVTEGLLDRPATFLNAMQALAPEPLGQDPRAVVHGDLYARHLLIDGYGRLSGVIDWGQTHIGNPAVDLALAYALLPHEAHAGFRSSYGDITKRLWSLAKYHAIYQSALVARLGLSLDDTGLRTAGLNALANLRRTIEAGA